MNYKENTCLTKLVVIANVSMLNRLNDSNIGQQLCTENNPVADFINKMFKNDKYGLSIKVGNL